MGDMKQRLGRMVGCLLLSAAACLGSGAARASCPVLDALGSASCYILVQAIDVCSSKGTFCAPFNTNSSTGSPTTQSQTGSNRIGFFDPNGHDITRALLNQIGIDLVYNNLPAGLTGGANIAQYNSPNKTGTTTTFQTLNVTQGATCTGSIAAIKGSNPPTGTLTISSCSSGLPTVSDTLSGSGVTSGTVITAIGTVSTGGAGTYTVSPSQTVKSTTITVTSSKFQSQDFLTLSYQPQIYQGAQTMSPNPVFPNAPLGVPSTVYNLFFVNTLSPPASQKGGQLNGFTYKGNNGTAIGTNTFSPPAGVPLPIDVFAHEFLHGLGLDHTTAGAGPWIAPAYTAPAGVAPTSCIGAITGTMLTIDSTGCSSGPLYVSASLSGTGIAAGTVITAFGPGTSGGAGTYTVSPPQLVPVPDGTTITAVPAHPLVGECDPSYPGCLSNLMTIGALRTEPLLACVLANPGAPPPTGCTTSSQSLYNGMADQLTIESQENSTYLPMSQQTQVLTSGLLYEPMNSGFLQPIPHETTKVQLATGDSSTEPVIFDLSRPVGGKPGETLVAWVLTLPKEQTFAIPSRLNIIAQSRKDLVQSVDYYPESENHPRMRDIAYQPAADDNPENPSIGMAAPSSCTSAAAECLMVKFRAPGLGAHDSISFSEGILKSILFSKGVLSDGGAPITNDDLCKAKITYIFSDGYATTSDLGPCPAKSLPLIASSWRPDLTVPPQIVRSNVLLAQSSGTSQAAPVMGSAYLNNSCSGNATINCLHSLNASPDVTFSVPSPNLACPGVFGTDFMGGTLSLCFNSYGSTYPNTDYPGSDYTLGSFLATGGATILTPPSNALTTALAANLDPDYTNATGTVFEFTGSVTVTNGQTFQVANDDGLSLMIGSNLVINNPVPQSYSGTPTTYTYTGPSGTFSFDLVYGETGGPPAVLGVSLPLQTPNPLNNPLVEGLADADKTELPQPGQICSTGHVTGTINGRVTVSAGQNCVYKDCEINGGVTINGGSFWSNCSVNGGIKQNGGMLILASSASVNGGLQISGASAFTIGPAVTINGSLQIQNLPAGLQQGTVCGTSMTGSLQATNNLSPIEIGGGGLCANNTAKQIQCQNNTDLISPSQCP